MTDRKSISKAMRARISLLYAEGASARTIEGKLGIGRERVRRVLQAMGVMRSRSGHWGTAEERLRTGYLVDGDGCWIWQGHKNKHGYGIIGVNGRQVLAHREMSALYGSPIPAGLEACHKCDKPSCVKPSHIYAGTRADNMRDAVLRGRTARGERNPHAKLTESAVLAIRAARQRGLALRAIGRQFKISECHVRDIVARKRWAHVE